MEKKKKVDIKELSVTQSNPLIEATYPRSLQRKDGKVELDNKMTTQAHKVSRLIVSLIHPEDKDLRLYRIDIDTLKSYLGYKENFPNGRFYQDLKDIAHSRQVKKQDTNNLCLMYLKFGLKSMLYVFCIF